MIKALIMGKRAFDKIMQGVEETREYLERAADKHRYRVHVREKIEIERRAGDEADSAVD